MSQELAANGALSLLNLACWLLDKQIYSLAEKFEQEGGFSERMYRIRKQKRDSNHNQH
ncbi:four helix bundle suffix domain-containing protein [Sedimentisphaera salicampi]|uniref:four helix bundle suffix domain-containing protein n=1 Tax=Sedimentisphaera salicampi TaxID=1941349 RepID=UPI000B9BFB4D|nr:four helix bundle suffix domain-containing protein [Sedimentisphaera salicampi]